MSSSPGYHKGAWEAIKRYDAALQLIWNAELNRWEVWRRGPRHRVMVLRLTNADGSYRPVDSRLLWYLVNNDGYKYKNSSELEREFRDYEQKQDKAVEDKFHDNIHEMVKERSRYMRRSFA